MNAVTRVVMRAAIHLTALLFGWLALAGSAVAADATFGEHGMALFGGKDGLYASHLPMFHAPHDYQVVLQLHIADPRTDAALRRRLDGKPLLWTLSPEKFELDRLAPQASHPLTQFKADLVQGHFEQNGKTQFAAATVVVDKVLVYRQLSPEQKTSATARYLSIGSGKQRYLVKEIDSRPDFDHIVSYRTNKHAPEEALTIAKPDLTEPDARTLATALHIEPSAIRGTVYFSTDDLK
jgi:hypothetical protein